MYKMDNNARTTPTNKTFPKYKGPIDTKSKLYISDSRVYGNISVTKLKDLPKKDDSNIEAEVKPPSFLDPKWNEIIESPKITNPSTFWFDNPNYLFQTFDILPQADMTDAERLNAMTRVIIVISAIMFLVQFQLWWLFLSLGLIVVIALWQLVKDRETIYLKSLRHQREYLRPRAIIKPINSISHPIPSNGGLPLNIVARIH